MSSEASQSTVPTVFGERPGDRHRVSAAKLTDVNDGDVSNGSSSMSWKTTDGPSEVMGPNF